MRTKGERVNDKNQNFELFLTQKRESKREKTCLSRTIYLNLWIPKLESAQNGKFLRKKPKFWRANDDDTGLFPICNPMQ